MMFLLINKEFLFYSLSTSPSNKTHLLSLNTLYLFIYSLMERVSLDFKGRCVKGEQGLIFLPL